MGVRYATPRPPQHAALLVPEDGSLPSAADMNAVFGDDWRFETRPDGTTHAMVREYEEFPRVHFRNITHRDRGCWVGYERARDSFEPRLFRIAERDPHHRLMLLPDDSAAEAASRDAG